MGGDNELGAQGVLRGDAGAGPLAADPLPLAAEPSPPESCTVTWINYAGLAALVAASFLAPRWSLSSPHAVLIPVLAAPALVIIVLEAIFIRARIAFRPIDPRGCYPRTATGFSPNARVILKIVGLAVSVGALALIYAVLPIYTGGGATYLIDLVRAVWLPLVLLAPLYVWFVDRRMTAPEDSCFHVGLWVTGHRDLVDHALIRQHCLQWTVKAFFLPLMLVFLSEKMEWMDRNPLAPTLVAFIDDPTAANWLQIYEYLYSYMFFIDTAFACVGYILTLKLLDAHIRTAEPTTMGWVVCLICYPPFWGLLELNYLNYTYGGQVWGQWLEGWPTLKVMFSLIILGLFAVYALATVQFGIRFSNLTHRGIVTNGPYRWMKHPAYFTKNAGWWFFYLPFLTTMGLTEALRACLLTVCLNLIYYVRARTEERHLMNDPVYREYVAFMREHDMFAWIRRAFAALVRGSYGANLVAK